MAAQQQYGYVTHNFSVASWSSSNTDECVQEPLLTLSKRVLAFYTIDNFDDTKIFVYLDELYDMSLKVMYKGMILAGRTNIYLAMKEIY